MPYTYAYRWLAQAMVSILGFGGGLLGLVIIIGGPARFSSSSLATARAVPGGLYTWGALFLLSGSFTLFGAWHKHNRLIRAGLIAQGFAFMFLDFSLIVTAFLEPKAALTGIVSYSMLAASCFAVWGTSKGLT